MLLWRFELLLSHIVSVKILPLNQKPISLCHTELNIFYLVFMKKIKNMMLDKVDGVLIGFEF